MNEKTEDRRIRKTKKALRDGLTSLMKDKSFKEISVKELTEEVDLNRGTFYLHYKDIFDLVDQIEDDIFNEFRNVLELHDPKTMNEHPFPLIEDIFVYLKQNSDLFTVFLSTNGDIAFIEQMKVLIREKCFNDWMLLFKKEEKFDYFYNYMLSGCIGLFTAWLQNGLKESPKEMASIAESLITEGIKFIK